MSPEPEVIKQIKCKINKVNKIEFEDIEKENMMKTFKVPTRLLEAAKRLKDNKTIYCGLDNEMKEVVKLAEEQEVLTHYGSKDGKFNHCSTPTVCYCLPDYIDIIVEQEQTWWQKEGLILCEIEIQDHETGWIIHYPNGNIYHIETLGIPRCEGYVFFGFVHNDKLENWNDIKSAAFGYFGKDDILWFTRQKGLTSSTATHTVWRKIEVK